MTLKIPTLNKKNMQNGDKSKESAVPSLTRIGRFLYRISYFTGKYAIKTARKVADGGASVFNVALSEIFRGAGDLARNISEFKRSRAGRGEVSITRGIMNAGEGISNTLRICREAFGRGGFRSGFAVTGRVIRRGAARFFASKKTAINYIAPLATIAVLAITVYFWSNACLAVSVSYDGKSLGVVASEKTFRDAADQVEQNVSDASGSSFELNRKVTLQMVLAKKSDLSDQDQIYNNIVMKSCNGVKTGYGLYVDNRLAGATNESGAIEAMLNDMTASYKADPQVQSVGFTQDVAVKSGVFPESVFKSIGEIKQTVTAKNKADSSDSKVTSLKSSGVFRISLDPLYAMGLSSDDSISQDDTVVTGSSQPTLTIKVVKNEIYTKSIPHGVKKTNSATLKKGKTKVSVNGKNGSEQVVAAVTYVDGEKVDEDVISSTTVKDPVTEVILVGTKKSTYSYGSDSGSGTTDYSGTYSGGILGAARNALGVPYVSGGSSYSGFDCSGFTKYVYSKYGVSLPHSAAAQSAYGSYVSKGNLQPGDLVFFDTNGGHNNISHVGIYVGGGSFIDASSARPHCITYDSINSAYYSNRYMTARRVLN